MAPEKAHLAPFPDEIEDFQADARITYSDDVGAWILKDENHDQWQWIQQVKKWTRAIDDAQVAQQSQAYTAQTGGSLKRKASDQDQPQEVKIQKSTKSDGQKPGPSKQPRASTAVYVTNLPLDATTEEIHEVFARFGVIAESLDTGEWRIKKYNDDDGNFKGEALVVYHRPESIANAIMMLDGTDFRLGESSQQKMSVTVADNTYKKHQESRPEMAQRTRDPEAERRKKQLKMKYEEMNSRLGDWSDDEPQTTQVAPRSTEKFLVLKAMFTLPQIQSEPSEILEITEDVRDECEKFGDVTKVVLFDKEEDGVVLVRFKTAEAAAAAAEKFNGRMFDGRQVIAYTSEGKDKFRKSGKEDDPEEERARLERFSKAVEHSRT